VELSFIGLKKIDNQMSQEAEVRHFEAKLGWPGFLIGHNADCAKRG
jgi:hypothetical protein